MIMLSVYKCMAGNASFVPLRQRIKLGLNCSILVMALCTSMVLMDRSGYAAINAGIDTILLVSALIKKNQPNGPFSTLFWNANSKWVEVVSRVKRVTISVAVVKQKVGKPHPPHHHHHHHHHGMGRMAEKLEWGRGYLQARGRKSSCGKRKIWRGPSPCGRKMKPNHPRTSYPRGRLP